MRRRLKTSVVIAIILAIAAVAGLIAQLISNSVDKTKYPQKYSEYVSKYCSEFAVPEYIVYSVIKNESGFDSSAKSSVGAIGLMQIMPETFIWLQEIRQVSPLPEGMLYDPETNIEYGVYYLGYLYRQYGSWKTVYAAYNGGITNVNDWLKNTEYSKDGKTLDRIPFKETSNYVRKVEKTVQKYKNIYYGG